MLAASSALSSLRSVLSGEISQTPAIRGERRSGFISIEPKAEPFRIDEPQSKDFLEASDTLGLSSCVPLRGTQAATNLLGSADVTSYVLIPLETAGLHPMNLSGNPAMFRQDIRETKTSARGRGAEINNGNPYHLRPARPAKPRWRNAVPRHLDDRCQRLLADPNGDPDPTLGPQPDADQQRSGLCEPDDGQHHQFGRGRHATVLVLMEQRRNNAQSDELERGQLFGSRHRCQ